MQPLERAYRLHKRTLMRLASRVIKPPAAPDDVVHDVFAATLARIRAGALDDSTALYPYLCSAVRRWAYQPRFRDVVLDAYAADPCPSKPSILTRLAVREAWAKLTPSERLAITHLHILEEDTSRLDYSVYASRIRIARRRLGAA